MTVDFEARYRVNGYGGVAFWLKGYSVEYRGGWYDDEYLTEEPVENENFVIGVMVGDDREHLIDVNDLEQISEDDYCHECGQIGCAHDGRDRS